MRFDEINFKYQRYGNDYVWAFDLSSRYHGYARNKLSGPYHVYDENTNGYTSYETKPAFESWLQNFGAGNNQTQHSNGNDLVYTGNFPKTNIAGFNATPVIILGAVGLIVWLILQKN